MEDILKDVFKRIDSDKLQPLSKKKKDNMGINTGSFFDFEFTEVNEFKALLFDRIYEINKYYSHWGDDVYYMLYVEKPKYNHDLTGLFAVSRGVLLKYFEYQYIGKALACIFNNDKNYKKYLLKEDYENDVPHEMIKIPFELYYYSKLSPEYIISMKSKIRTVYSGIDEFNYVNRLYILGIIIPPKIKTRYKGYVYLLTNFKRYLPSSIHKLYGEKTSDIYAMMTDEEIIAMFKVKKWEGRKDMITQVRKMKELSV